MWILNDKIRIIFMPNISKTWIIFYWLKIHLHTPNIQNFWNMEIIQKCIQFIRIVCKQACSIYLIFLHTRYLFYFYSLWIGLTSYKNSEHVLRAKIDMTSFPMLYVLRGIPKQRWQTRGRWLAKCLHYYINVCSKLAY